MQTELRINECAVLESTMSWVEAGDRDAPVAIFLHGNPTSSHIWRNILPIVARVAHCVAPDLIGYGRSGKPDVEYRFADHVRYLDAFMEGQGITSAYLVAQDWGTALAFHLAARKPDLVHGLAFMEFIRPTPTWDDFHQSSEARELFRKFRTAGVGETLILDNNVLVERVPRSIVRTLSAEEMAPYRAPFPTPQSRRPIWRLANELPIAGEPADVYQLIEAAHSALAASTYPKLLFVGEPGALVSPDFARGFAASLKNCGLVYLGPGRHHLQEDHSAAIGYSIAGWMTGIEAARRLRAA